MRRELADGRYLLVRKVAEGGTAFVHLGYDTWTETWRAVKTLLPEYARRPALRHRFEREAATMKTLSHDNIIAVYDAGIEEDTVFMVMEFAEAGSVIDWVERNGPMPPRMATNVVLELCRGIDAAHRQGVVHRDIKPQNLLVDRHGVCKVTDFGIAQVLENTRMTMTGTVMGTMGYMAPEQNDSAKHADERADVYSIAATFYTLLKGEAATHLFMAEEPDFEGIPPNLMAIIRHGSYYKKEERYQTVRDMRDDLESALRLLPPDPLDTPPLVPDDIPNLEDFTPPSFEPGSVASQTGAAMLVPVDDPPPEPQSDVVIGLDEEGDERSLDRATWPQEELQADATPEPYQQLPELRRTPPGLAGRTAPNRNREVIRALVVGGATVVAMVFLAGVVFATISASTIQRIEHQVTLKYGDIIKMSRDRVQGQVMPACDSIRTMGIHCDACDDLGRRLGDIESTPAPEAKLANVRRLTLVLDDLCQCISAFSPEYPNLRGPMQNVCRANHDLELALLDYDALVRSCDTELDTVGGSLGRAAGFVSSPACVVSR